MQGEMFHITDWTGRGAWTKKAGLPGVRCETALAAVGDRVYVIGGSYANFANRPNVLGTALQRNEYYDTTLDVWRACAPIPEGRDHCALAVIGDVIYEFGGFTHLVHQGAHEQCFAYDTKGDTWRRLAPMKEERGSASAAIVDGRIHIMGGRGEDPTVMVTRHEVYDPATDTWSEGAPLTRGRDHMAVQVVNGKIHAIGGRAGATWLRLDLHEVYDPKTDSWSDALPLPTPRSGVASALLKGKIIVVGGELTVSTGGGKSQPYYCFAENEAYDAASDTWTTLHPMPGGRHGFGGAVVGDTAYFAGGSLLPGIRGVTDEMLAFEL